MSDHSTRQGGPPSAPSTEGELTLYTEAEVQACIERAREGERNRFTRAFKTLLEQLRVEQNPRAHALLELFETFQRVNRDDYQAIQQGWVPPHILVLLKKLLPSD